MAKISEGSKKQVTIPAGKMLTVSATGKATVRHVSGFKQNTYYSDPVTGKNSLYPPTDVKRVAEIHAITEDVNYTVAYPHVTGVKFKRGSNGKITAVIDPKDGSEVAIGIGDVSVNWGDLQGKPGVIAAGDTKAEARSAIGAGTSSFDGKYGSLTDAPSIPSKVSDLSDGGDYAKTSQLFDGQYGSLTGAPDVPGDASEVSLTANVSGESDVQAALAALETRIAALEGT